MASYRIGAFAFVQLIHRNVEADLALVLLAEIHQVAGVLRLGPRIDRAVLQGQRPVRNHQIQVVVDGVAETLAALAGSVGIVEAEQAGLRLEEFLAAAFASELLVEAQGFAFHRGLKNRLARFAITDLQRVHQALAHPAEIDRRSTSANTGLEKSRSSRDSGVENSTIFGPPFDADQPVEPSLAQIEQAVAQSVGGLFLRQGKQRVPARAFRLRQHRRRDMIHGVALHAAVAVGAIGAAGASPQQAQKIVQLRGGGDGRSRVARGVLLADRHRRRDAVDFVDLRPLHALQKLAGVSRKRFDVAALPLGVNRIEGQRGFAGAGDAGDHGQLLMRDFERDVLKVVDTRATNADAVLNCFVQGKGLHISIGV